MWPRRVAVTPAGHGDIVQGPRTPGATTTAWRHVPLARVLWRTLKALVLHPGLLTTLYLRGARARFVGPLRLHVFSGLLFVALLTFALEGPRVQLDLLDFNLVIRPPSVDCPGTTRLACDAIDRAAARFGHPRGTWPAAASRRLLEFAAVAAFLLMPAFAAIVARLYRNRQVRWRGHLVFAAHLHAFWFLLGVLTLYMTARLAIGAALVALGYGLCSMNEVYGGRWQVTALRAAILVAAQACLVLVAVLGLAPFLPAQ